MRLVETMGQGVHKIPGGFFVIFMTGPGWLIPGLHRLVSAEKTIGHNHLVVTHRMPLGTTAGGNNTGCVSTRTGGARITVCTSHK